jgi:K+-sensing histidine kinase KdpD
VRIPPDPRAPGGARLDTDAEARSDDAPSGVTDRTARIARELAARDRVAGLLSHSGELSSLLEDVLHTVLSATERPVGAVFLVDHEASEIRLTAHRNIPRRLVAELSRRALPLEHGLLARVLKHGDALVTEQFSEDSRLGTTIREMVGCDVSILMPLTAAGRDVGVLAIFDPTRRPVDRDEIAFVRGVGLQLGLMLENARLTHVERLKDDFLSLVSHELRTPTTTIRAGLSTLRRHRHLLDTEAMTQLMDDMAEESERLHLLIEDLLSLTAQQRGAGLPTEPVSARHLINQVLALMRERTAGHDVRVEVPAGLPAVEAEPTYFQHVIRNLVVNAVTYSPSGSEVLVRARAGETDAQFSVLDRGEGVPSQEADKIFRPFYRAPHVRLLTSGAGLGLTVCRRLLEAQGGSIWAESRPDGGTAFHFTLPLAT